MTVVDVLSQRLEHEQELSKRQADVINDFKLQLLAFQGVQVSGSSHVQ
jgi:hypothetical protein